ncbi:MAG TPA: hypothetical protein VM553_19175 [Dongiaceae bacterium]|nr:hypothetical protein [Dongiaceae bacterium]
MLVAAVETQANDFFSTTSFSNAGIYDMHSVGAVDSAVPLISFNLTASTDAMRGNSVDFAASYRSVGLNVAKQELGYNQVSTAFSLNAPRLQGMDFSDAIREKVESCPEKMIDKLIIDGAVGLAYAW